jgi:hypothetical protein
MARTAKLPNTALRPGDEDLAFELIAGRLVRDSKGRRVLSIRYIKRGSDREREARASMVRLLVNDYHKLSPGFRMRLAALFDTDPSYETRELVFKNRKRGAQPNHLVDMSIAGEIAREIEEGMPTDAAIQSAADRYGVSRTTAYRAWEKYRRFVQPVDRSLN